MTRRRIHSRLCHSRVDRRRWPFVLHDELAQLHRRLCAGGDRPRAADRRRRHRIVRQAAFGVAAYATAWLTTAWDIRHGSGLAVAWLSPAGPPLCWAGDLAARHFVAQHARMGPRHRFLFGNIEAWEFPPGLSGLPPISIFGVRLMQARRYIT